MDYTDDFEHILKGEAEKAECLSILHTHSSHRFNFFYIIINLPIIGLSSIVGLLSAIELFEYQHILYAIIFVLLGILKAIDSFFMFAKRSETHRLISLSYLKIHKNILIQLSLSRDKRVDAKILYRMITTDINNITESEPAIPTSIIKQFKKKYEKYQTQKPSILNGLTSINIHPTNLYEVSTTTASSSSMSEQFPVDIPQHVTMRSLSIPTSEINSSTEPYS